MQFHDIDGIIGKSFQLGYGKDSFTFTIGDDGVLTIQFNNEPIVEGSPYSYPLRFRLMGGIDCNNGAIKSTFSATENVDVVNLSVLKTKLEAYLTSAKTYTDQKIQESGGGSSGGGGTSPMLSPLAVTVDNMADGYSAIIGSLAANKFIGISARPLPAMPSIASLSPLIRSRFLLPPLSRSSITIIPQSVLL